MFYNANCNAPNVTCSQFDRAKFPLPHHLLQHACATICANTSVGGAVLITRHSLLNSTCIPNSQEPGKATADHTRNQMSGIMVFPLPRMIVNGCFMLFCRLPLRERCYSVFYMLELVHDPVTLK
jgi:hypothetical protein